MPFDMISNLVMIWYSIWAADGFSNPSGKTWWSKRVTSDSFHTAGRLSARQIIYASESGFKTIVSLFNYGSSVGDNSTEGGSYLPSTAGARYIAEDLAGINYATVLDSPGPDDWKNLDVIQKFAEIVSVNPNPILFHCTNSYAATFVLLAFFAYQLSNGNRWQAISGSDVFRIGLELGYDYSQDDSLKDLVYDMTGVIQVSPIVELNPSPRNWYEHFWSMKPVHGNIFVAGEIQTRDFPLLSSAGIRTIINVREETFTAVGWSFQEELNVFSMNEEIVINEVFEQQRGHAHPEAHQIFSPQSKEDSGISSNSLESGDMIWIRAQEMDAFARKLGMQYVVLLNENENAPELDMWTSSNDRLLKLLERGPILLHSKTGFHSAILGLLSAAYVNCFSSDWAIERGRQIGYNFKGPDPGVHNLFQDVLDPRHEHEDCINRRVQSKQGHHATHQDDTNRPKITLSVVIVGMASILILMHFCCVTYF